MKKSFLLPATLCASLTCQAGNYFFEPVFSANERYNSNLFMRQTPPQDNWISTLSPGVNFGLRRENSELKSNFTWNQVFYTNQSDLNIDEQLFSANYQHKSERLQWGTSGYFNNRSSLNTEGTVTGGLVFNQVMAKQLNLAPTVSYALDELSSLSVDYTYNKTTYAKNQNPFLSDYDYHQVSGTFTHLYTERDKLNLTLSGSRYKLVVRDHPTFNEVAQLGWQHSFNEQLVTYVSAGINYSQTKLTEPQLPFSGVVIGGLPLYFDPVTNSFTLSQRFEDVENNKIGQVYQASIQKTFERGAISLVGMQNQTPTSQGLQTQTQLASNNTYTINERWNSSLSASFTRYEIPGQENSPFNRTYFAISPNINWKWTPEINIGLSYTFRHQEFQNSTQGNAEGNIVQLQFSYQPQINHQVK